jgi:polar amino acid transport system permease protein
VGNVVGKRKLPRPSGCAMPAGWHVVLPQAVKLAIAPTVGFLVQRIKSTSLAAIIGFTGLTRAGQIVNNATFRPFVVFGIAAALSFVMCWPIPLLSRYLEWRYSAPARR